MKSESGMKLVTIISISAAMAAACDTTDRRISTGAGGAGGAPEPGNDGGSVGAGAHDGGGGWVPGGGGTPNVGGQSVGGQAQGGEGGTGTSASELNGCILATATDLTNETAVEIRFPVGGYLYNPACSRVSVGTPVTFLGVAGNFQLHPLEGGTVDVAAETGTPDPNSPIVLTETGTSTTFTMDQPGTYGFYCDAHIPSGMFGAIFVQP